jgi:hypothetical protein
MVVAVIIALHGFACGQTIPKSERIDQFGQPTCEELAARSQNFANQISNDPSSKGLVIVKTSDRRRAGVQSQFKALIASLASFNADDRVEFVVNTNAKEEVWELWRIPSGADEPVYKGEKWRMPEPDVTKAFIYGYEDEDTICPPTFVIRKFADLLTKNPGSRAHIVVRKNTTYRASEKGFADQWVKDLISRFSIARNRIRVFYARGDDSPTYAEFWFVPAKKR